MVVVAVLIVFATFKWIHSFTNHGEHVEVPLVEGLISDEAMVVLKNNMLQGEITEYRYQSNLEEGAVIEQRPETGSFVKEGRTVYLVVNSGKVPMKMIPDVADNSSLRAAESRAIFPAIPTKDGYTFEMWRVRKEVDTGEVDENQNPIMATVYEEYDFSTPVKEDITLYALWFGGSE